ncbi:MAG TPA: fatty acid desaturase [Tepidisphaeraceae bacterium]|jgi:fatty acid desaturase
MDGAQQKLRVAWYRCPVGRENLRQLNQRSDIKGLLQTLGYLGVLATTGTAAFISAARWPWYATLGLLMLHGMCWAFMINGFHELVHESVFKTRWLNGFFLRILSFLGWYNHHQFWASHTEHHKYTLHPPDDLEVVLPVKLTLKSFLQGALVNPWGLWFVLKINIRYARGKLEGPWEHALFDNNPEKRRDLFRWSRIVLAGQATIVAVSILMHWWMLPVVTTLAPFYGGWLFFLCNNAQHVGLKDNVPDFRLCCRTITLSPIVQFLYWHMNYHTEHHMYAAVPCYNLGKLHRIIRPQMPPCPRGLYATWKHITEVLKKQRQDPTYQYVPELPPAPPRGEQASELPEAVEAPVAG